MLHKELPIPAQVLVWLRELDHQRRGALVAANASAKVAQDLERDFNRVAETACFSLGIADANVGVDLEKGIFTLAVPWKDPGPEVRDPDPPNLTSPAPGE